MEMESRLEIAREWGRRMRMGAGVMGCDPSWVQFSFQSDENILTLVSEIAAQACEYTKAH